MRLFFKPGHDNTGKKWDNVNVASGQTDECEDIKVEPMELHKTAFAKPLMIVSLIRKIQLQGRIFMSPPEKGSRVEARRRMGALKWSHRLIGPLCIRRGAGTYYGMGTIG